MTRPVLAFAVLQLADCATSFALGPGMEANPIRAAADPLAAVALKAALVVLILATVVVIRRSQALATAVLLVGIVAGALGLGSNLGALA